MPNWIGCVLVIAWVMLLSCDAFASTHILNVRHWSAPDHTRVVFDLNNTPRYSHSIENNRLTIVLTDAMLRLPPSMESLAGQPGIRKITFRQAAKNRVLIDVELDEPLRVSVFMLKQFLDKPDRLVVDVFIRQTPVATPAPAMQKPLLPMTDRVIVVDPGHGGEDPGAIGLRGTYEKHVVLQISQEIKRAIDAMPGYRAVLTRDGDYYVSFNRRLQIAREQNASLFISVHADAARNRQARGSSIYCLSTGGASNEAARVLANNENLSDIIGGVPDGDTNHESDPILLNMFQTNTINMSKTFAAELIRQIGSVHYLKYDSHQEAPFRVLRLLDIPAVLLETAYLSNPQEERLLQNRTFQRRMATAVAASVERYFVATPARVVSADPVLQVIATRDAQAAVPTPVVRQTASVRVYHVQRGDTLFSISRRYGTDVENLMRLNNLNRADRLNTGQRIRVPANVEPQIGRPTRSYVVQPGDTLYSLARNHAITIDELRSLNRMGANDPLLSGQAIRVPHP